MTNDTASIIDTFREQLLEAHLHHTREKVRLLEALNARFGPEVEAVVARTAREEARQQWAAQAEKTGGGRSPAELVALLWEPLRAKGFAFTATPEGTGVRISCTRCPIADLARAVGGTRWMFHLTCGTDEAIAEGFNPRIRLRRTCTLMEGHSRCDHFYDLMEQTGASAG